MTVYDASGRTLDLVGSGHRGGEGTVYRIAGDPSRVAKLYHDGRSVAGLHTKLRVMLANPPADPSRNGTAHRSIAWVDGLLFGDRSGRDLRGFTMPSVDTSEFREAHVYYDLADRLRIFGGGFTWRHLMCAARNLASAVDAIHAAGHRVGDLRETNLLVGPTALVTLIDCDSFQIRDPRTGDVHPTRVATGDYLPPELHGTDFRTQHPDRYGSDLFALAVLVFRFLMLGAHPFQARGPGVSDAPTTEAKIRKGVFAYAGRARGAEPPEYAPPYEIVPKALRKLFARAFIAGHRDPDARPSAAEWADALEMQGQQIKACRSNANHWHAARACPWCAMTSDPFPGGLPARRQVAMPGAPSRNGDASRIEEVRAYARVALVDGPVTDAEFFYLRKLGAELGLQTPAVDEVIDDESRRAATKVLAPQNGGTNGSSLRTLTHPIRTIRAVGNRSTRSAIKAAAPVLVLTTVAGALAPVLAPIAAAVICLPALATIGELSSRPGWRAKAKLPWAFAVHAHVVSGHASRVFVPLAALGGAVWWLTELPDVWIVRTGGACAMFVLAFVAIARLPYTRDGSAPSMLAGRNIVWRGLVGASGRTRRSAYVVWAACVAALAALYAGHVLWWPLPMP